MSKIIIVGVGAQGSTIAKHLNEHRTVTEMLLADYNFELAERLCSSLSKATPLKLDASDTDRIIEASQGCEIIFNGLPLEYNLKVMEAALAVGAHYMDLAGPMEEIGFVESYKLILGDWSERFAAKGLLGLVGCGIAPGLANIIVRDCVEELDSCEFIGMYFYDGFQTNRFIPFWWSPEVAVADMGYSTFRFENGEHVTDTPFSRPKMIEFRGVDRPIRVVDHEHDEPVTMGLMADKVLKGVKNIEFKYGGPQVELCEMLYKMGLLSKELVDVKGQKVAPFDVVMKQIPRAPIFPDEIKEVIDAGIKSEEGAFLVRVDGVKDGKPVRFDNYTNLPGLEESFEKAGLTHESYSTGQCAAVYAKLMVEELCGERGVIVPEQLDDKCRRYLFDELAKLEITVERFES